MSEIVTIKATKGSDGKFYYFESKGSPDTSGDMPLYTRRIAKEEFERLAKKQRKNFDKIYNEQNELIQFKYVDDHGELWIKQNTKPKKGCAGLFILGFISITYLLFKVVF